MFSGLYTNYQQVDAYSLPPATGVRRSVDVGPVELFDTGVPMEIEVVDEHDNVVEVFYSTRRRL